MLYRFLLIEMFDFMWVARSASNIIYYTWLMHAGAKLKKTLCDPQRVKIP